MRSLSDTRSEDLLEGLEQAARESAQLLDEQRQIEESLREAVELAARSRQSGLFTPGLTREQMLDL